MNIPIKNLLFLVLFWCLPGFCALTEGKQSKLTIKEQVLNVHKQIMALQMISSPDQNVKTTIQKRQNEYTTLKKQHSEILNKQNIIKNYITKNEKEEQITSKLLLGSKEGIDEATMQYNLIQFFYTDILVNYSHIEERKNRVFYVYIILQPNPSNEEMDQIQIYGRGTIDGSLFSGRGGFHVDKATNREYKEFLSNYLYYKCHPVRWWATKVGVSTLAIGIIATLLYKKGIFTKLKTFAIKK